VNVKITIAGKRVHDIGYRYYLMENALAFGIERFRAVNIVKDKQVVEVFVEGEDDSIKSVSSLRLIFQVSIYLAYSFPC